MLRVEHLRLGALPPLNFEVPDGQCLSIKGPSGSGKTRLLRQIADLDPVSGHLFLDGAERSEMPADTWRHLVRYVAAEPGWWTPTPRGAFPPVSLETGRLERLLGNVGLAPLHLDRDLAHLSTGERQRLALVRALVDEPKVLLLDEPTSALDSESAALVEALIQFQLFSGRSIVLVSHDAGLVARQANTHLVLPRPRPSDAVPADGSKPRADP